MTSKITKLIGSVAVITTTAALTFAFTSPTNAPTSSSSMEGSLLYQMAGGSDFNTATDSLHAISCSLDANQASCQ